jgi:hypothetical protein
MSTDAQKNNDRQARQKWQKWREQRRPRCRRRTAPLAHRHPLAFRFPEGRITAVPGSWTANGDEVVLTAFAEDGLTVGFNHSLLPPCAFADHFICAFPPPGNTVSAGVPAGEPEPSGPLTRLTVGQTRPSPVATEPPG